MDIQGTVNFLQNQYGTKDPDELAACLDLHIYERSDFKHLLGMYAVVEGRRCVFLNANIDEVQRKLILAHEIGHDQLHQKEAAAQGLVEFTLFDMTSRGEYEANVFAAHLLLDDQEIHDLAKEGYDVVSIAQMLKVNINLLLIKLHEMKKMGYEISEQEIPDKNFLKGTRRTDIL